MFIALLLHRLVCFHVGVAAAAAVPVHDVVYDVEALDNSMSRISSHTVGSLMRHGGRDS